MQTRVDEIAERVYRLSTYVPSPGGAAGFTFNQFLIDAEEPLLFHCGQRSLFASESKAMARIMDVGPALATEKRFRFVPLTPDTAPALRRLAALSPRVLALMHGPAFTGQCTPALETLATHYDTELCRAVTS